jgi:SAM-dependent methyltransferase
VPNVTRRQWRALLRAAYHRAFRCQLHLRFWLADHLGRTSQAAGTPLPPALLRYRVGESLSGWDFLRIGQACVYHIERQLNCSGATLGDMERVLDFGCGCGRTLRWLIERFPATQFYGADVDREAIEWCRRHLSKATCVDSQPEPPLPFHSCHFDLVYCVSVFTHLDERMQDIWLTEISRILKRSGVLILTVHGQHARSMIRDQELANRLRDTGFAHQRSQKLSGMVPEWYNTSWHSRSYILNKLCGLFGTVSYEVVPDGSQDLVIARAPFQTGR